MLRGVSLHLARLGHAVSVIARRRKRLQSLVEAAAGFPGEIVPLQVDYGDSAELEGALERSAEALGPIQLVVCWVHSVANDPLSVVAKTMAAASYSARLFHVRGSAVANPAEGGPRVPRSVLAFPALGYRQVVLGFVIENGRSRWLTHQEISGGVIEAVTSDREYSIVGTVEPWSMRP